jgi:high affinity sulfate transporter 1
MIAQQRATPSGIRKYLPVLSWLPGYPAGWLRFDLVAGLTAAAVVIPQAMAYAAIAGLPVQVGLYTALVPMLIYVLLGTSRPLSVSSTSTISMLTATELARVAQGGDPVDYLIAASTQALLVGVFLLVAGLLRLGFLANFISLPVLTGFKAGIGLVILVGQLGKVLGIPVEKGPVLQTVLQILGNLDQIHWLTLAVSLVTLAILIFLPRLTKRLPAPLVAVALGILASALLNLDALGVKLVGDIPTGLPSFYLPDLSLVPALWPGALGIALISFVESIAAARTFAKYDDPPVDADQELRALGAANIGGSFFQAYPAGGGTSQTAVNDQAGARSQLAEAVTAGVVIVTLLFLAPLIGLMPEASLGALVLAAAAGLIKIGEFRAIGQIRRHELAWAIVTFVGVVILGTLEGILVAVIISMLDIIVQANHPPLYVMGRKPGTHVFRPLRDYPGDETFPGLLLVRTEGRIYFANAARVREKALALIQQEQPRVIAIDCSAIPDIEYTALRQLVGLEERLREAGIMLWLTALNPGPLRTIQQSSLGETLGRERMFFNLEQAVEAYVRMQAQQTVEE